MKPSFLDVLVYIVSVYKYMFHIYIHADHIQNIMYISCVCKLIMIVYIPSSTIHASISIYLKCMIVGTMSRGVVPAFASADLPGAFLFHPWNFGCS